MTEGKKLEIGDKIYITQYGSVIEKIFITRVTRTQAKTDNYTFDIEVQGNGYCKIKGQTGWATKSAHLATKELDREWEEKKLRIWWNQEKDKMTIKDIRAIKMLLRKFNKE